MACFAASLTLQLPCWTTDGCACARRPIHAPALARPQHPAAVPAAAGVGCRDAAQQQEAGRDAGPNTHLHQLCVGGEGGRGRFGGLAVQDPGCLGALSACPSSPTVHDEGEGGEGDLRACPSEIFALCSSAGTLVDGYRLSGQPTPHRSPPHSSYCAAASSRRSISGRSLALSALQSSHALTGKTGSFGYMAPVRGILAQQCAVCTAVCTPADLLCRWCSSPLPLPLPCKGWRPAVGGRAVSHM